MYEDMISVNVAYPFFCCCGVAALLDVAASMLAVWTILVNAAGFDDTWLAEQTLEALDIRLAAVFAAADACCRVRCLRVARASEVGGMSQRDAQKAMTATAIAAWDPLDLANSLASPARASYSSSFFSFVCLLSTRLGRRKQKATATISEVKAPCRIQ